MWLLTCCSSIARTVVPGARPLVEVVPAVNNVSSHVSRVTRVTFNTCLSPVVPHEVRGAVPVEAAEVEVGEVAGVDLALGLRLPVGEPHTPETVRVMI